MFFGSYMVCPKDILGEMCLDLWPFYHLLPRKINMAKLLQWKRKRVKTLTKKDLESYFHIKQKSAAHIGLSIARLENKFNNNLKKRITEWNLGKVQGVTKAFKLRKEKEQFYQKK
uniref:Uncharacterized protein n=1 Tax=Oryza rufipogon TaxID=4529 RepID=A0A0E0QS22_ORYRU